jgi:hypothetical protein
VNIHDNQHLAIDRGSVLGQHLMARPAGDRISLQSALDGRIGRYLDSTGDVYLAPHLRRSGLRWAHQKRPSVQIRNGRVEASARGMLAACMVQPAN